MNEKEKTKNELNYFFSVNQFKNGSHIKSLYSMNNISEKKKRKSLLFSITKPKFERYISFHIMTDLYKYKVYCEFKLDLLTKSYNIKSIPIGISSLLFYYNSNLQNNIIDHWKDIMYIYSYVNENNIFEVKKFVSHFIKRKIYTVISYVDSIENKVNQMNKINLLINSNFNIINNLFIEKKLLKKNIDKFINENNNILSNYLDDINKYINPNLVNNFSLQSEDFNYSISKENIKKIEGEKNVIISLINSNYFIYFKNKKEFYGITKKDDIINFLTEPNIIGFSISKNKIIYENNHIERKENKYYYGKYVNNIFNGCIIKEDDIEYISIENDNSIDNKKSSSQKESTDISINNNDEDVNLTDL